MSNFLGTDTFKIEFTFDSIDYVVEFDTHRNEGEFNLNQQQLREHRSVLNGTIVKEFLGFYHECVLTLKNITQSEYEDKLRFIEYVDTITVYPFKDNEILKIECIVDEVTPVEFNNISTLKDNFIIKCSSSEYEELEFTIDVEGFAMFTKQLQIPVDEIDGYGMFLNDISS